MKINEVKDRLQCLDIDNKKYSSFVLVDYNGGIVNEVIPLENKTTNLEFKNKDLTLTDKDGNILLEKDEREKKEIVYVDKNTIVITDKIIVPRMVGEMQVPVDLKQYKYVDDKKQLIEEKYLIDHKDEIMLNAYCPNEDYPIIVIDTAKGKNRRSVLYSAEKDYISPRFRTLEKTDNKNLLKFTDEIESNSLLYNKKLTNYIIGFINLNGKFHDEVFDSYNNTIRKVDLNSYSKFIKYNEFKKTLAKELDEEVEKLVNKTTNKKFLIRRLEANANRDN